MYAYIHIYMYTSILSYTLVGGDAPARLEVGRRLAIHHKSTIYIYISLHIFTYVD